jgi:hypothetical protein
LGDRLTEATFLCRPGNVAGYTVCRIGLVEAACDRRGWKEAVRQLAKINAASDRLTNRELRLRVASIQQSVSEAMGQYRYQDAMDLEKEPMEQAR